MRCLTHLLLLLLEPHSREESPWRARDQLRSNLKDRQVFKTSPPPSYPQHTASLNTNKYHRSTGVPPVSLCIFLTWRCIVWIAKFIYVIKLVYFWLSSIWREPFFLPKTPSFGSTELIASTTFCRCKALFSQTEMSWKRLSHEIEMGYIGRWSDSMGHNGAMILGYFI